MPWGRCDAGTTAAGHSEACTDPTHWYDTGPRWRSNTEIVGLLRRLERLGHIERLVIDRRLTPHGAHYWRYLG
jgi:hypothetical protein